MSDTILFDYDYLLYQAACAVEERSVTVVHKETGEEFVCKNKTEFYGRGKKITGVLAELNEKRNKEYTKEDFLIIDNIESGDISDAKMMLTTQINNIRKQLDIKSYYGYSGSGDTFRHTLATLMPYKGNREALHKPEHLPELKEYLVQRHNCEIVTEIEADDGVSMDSHYYYKQWCKKGGDKVITVSIDKDAKGCTGFLFNPNKDFEPLEINGLGSVWRDEKIVDGFGRAFFYYQLCRGDDIDNYDPACLSDMNVGDVTAINALKGCQTDKQYWQAIVDFYKKMYPEPVTFTNFRGDELTVDWLYILQEITDLAHMLRWEGDRLVVKNILTNLEVNYE